MTLEERVKIKLEKFMKSTNEEILFSFKVNHSPLEEIQLLERSNHSTGTVSIASYNGNDKLKEAFKKADKIFATLN